MRSRSRAKTVTVGSGGYSQTLFGVTTNTPYKITVGENQTMLDEVHPWWTYHEGKLQGKFNIGGSMTSTRRRISHHDLPVKAESATLSGNTFKLTGPRVPEQFYQATGISNYLAAPSVPTDNQLNAWGTRGVNRTIPTSPAWNLAQFMGELHEGLPKIPLKNLLRDKSTKGLGGEYLNYQFGISPFINDFDQLKSAIIKSDDLERQLIAGSGKLLSRRVSLVNEMTTSESKTTQGLYPQIPWVSPSKNQIQVTKTVHSFTNVWFSGTYSYLYKPSANPVKNQLDRLRHVYGIDPSISTAWELMPYSWLIDWQTNVGEVLENVSLFAKDGLAMRWGYVMCHQIELVTYSFAPYGSISLLTENKIRRPGNPFGFASTYDGYTNRQKAILAALGMVKGPHLRL